MLMSKRRCVNNTYVKNKLRGKITQGEWWYLDRYEQGIGLLVEVLVQEDLSQDVVILLEFEQLRKIVRHASAAFATFAAVGIRSWHAM